VPPFGIADSSSPIISKGTPNRSICALTSYGPAERLARPVAIVLRGLGLSERHADATLVQLSARSPNIRQITPAQLLPAG
jgi:hypothetical protein